MAVEEPVIVVNLAEINRNLRRSGKQVSAATHKGLLEAAEPVKRDADALSRSEISGMKRARKSPPPWSIQKEGSTVSEVYIVPKERGKRGGRTDGDRRRATKFVELMYGRSYNPALERNRALVVQTVDNWLGRVTREL